MSDKLQQVQFPAQLMKIETRTDGSIKVLIETQELSGEEAAKLFGYRGALGYVTFTPNAISEVYVPESTAAYDGKSPSQKMRSVLYLLWEQSGKKVDTFEQYYAQQVERMTNQLKDRLI